MAEADSSVWIGFMDIVPVIGTVKESVELVLAVYEGNKAVIKEKEKALEKILKEPYKKTMKLKKEHKPESAATGYSGLNNVMEVGKGKINDHVAHGSRLKTMTAKEKANRVQVVKEGVVQKLDSIGKTLNQELKEQMTRSMRGEHVFNNGILTFHSKVLNDFIQNQQLPNRRGFNQNDMNPLGQHNLPVGTPEEIRDHMVVHFDAKEFYVNANAILYGEYCRALTVAYLNVLRHINPGDESENERREVNRVIDSMNNHQIYVDELAREKWIAGRDRVSRQTRVDVVRRNVSHMFNGNFGLNWCTRVMHAVAPFYAWSQ